MDFSQMNEMYIVTKYFVGKGEMKIVGLFRGKENADRYIKEHTTAEFIYSRERITTDF